jgi:hypothetical protein
MIQNTPLRFCAWGVVLPLLAICGCGTTQNDLTMTGVDQRHDFKQVFSQAYSSLNDTGDYDVVLIHDANADPSNEDGTAVLPAPVSPRQIVHIRVFWFPERGTKLDHPVATNASIRWYIFGDRPSEGADLLEYSGSGLVLVNDDGKTATVTVRGATLKMTARRGLMTDPLGPSSVNGEITAHVDRHGVQTIISELDAAEQAGKVQSVSVRN